MAAASEQRQVGSTASVPIRVIDADGHIFEPEELFASLEADFYPRRPAMVDLPPDTVTREPRVDDRRASGPDGHRPGATFFTVPGSLSSAKKKVPLSDQTLEDVEASCTGSTSTGSRRSSFRRCSSCQQWRTCGLRRLWTTPTTST